MRKPVVCPACRNDDQRKFGMVYEKRVWMSIAINTDRTYDYPDNDVNDYEAHVVMSPSGQNLLFCQECRHRFYARLKAFS